MRKLFTVPWLLAAAAAALVCTAPPVAVAEEWEENTAYYEDDAWYDITEWLDGNDYNPTDEVPGLWDDEQYDWAAVETDADSDFAAGYGYDNNNKDDDWYYDYYDDFDYVYYDYLDDGLYDYVYDYYDYDDDGYYDAFASFQDTDGDGLFDDYDYYAFNVSTSADDSQDSSSQTAANNQGQKQEPKARGSSKQFQASGKVEQAKRVQVRHGGQRLIVQLKSDQGKMFLVDLGRPQELSGQQQQQGQAAQQGAAQQGQQNLPVKPGDQLTAKGPVIKVGDKQVVLAQTVTINNQQRQINRAGRTINGQIATLKTVKVRGQEHQMAILNLQSGKQALVDMGPADKLQTGLKEGDQVQVSGVPVKVQDRMVILANAVTTNGEKTKIDRVAAKPAGQSS